MAMFDNLFTPVLLSTILSSTAVGFTGATSTFRYAVVPPIVSLAIASLRISIQEYKDGTSTPIYKALLVALAFVTILQHLDSALLSRWTFESQGPTSGAGGHRDIRTVTTAYSIRPKHDHAPAAKPNDTWLQRFLFGFARCFDWRFPATPWEVNHTPKFIPSQPSHIPSKGQFLYWTSGRILICLLALDVLGVMRRDTSQNEVLFSQSKIQLFSRLSEVTAEELPVRVLAAILQWSGAIVILQIIYDVTAFLFVGLSFSSVERWPPLFGTWSECWSLRQFWG